MTSASRISLAARLVLPPPGYVCLQCRLRASTAAQMTNPSITLPYASRRQSSWIDAEKLRKKIWGTDTPPGPADPYTRESEIDRRRREREQEGAERDSDKDLPKYVEATTTEGLETIGGPGWGAKRWGEVNRFQGFMELERTGDRYGIILAIHRALVETYALKEAGLPLVMDFYSLDPTDKYAVNVTEGAKFEQDTNGQTALVLKSEELRQSILECVTPKDRSSPDEAVEYGELEDEGSEEDVDEMESKEAAEQRSQDVEEDDKMDLESEDSESPAPEEEPLDFTKLDDLAAFMLPSDTWRDVSLEDTAIKFAVLKRVMQLTGRRIPDPDISAISTPKSLLVHLVKKPKPKKIAEALRSSNRLTGLPNVQILDKRYGPISREVEVGRWKVIVKELKKRGLPVTGRASVRPARRSKEQRPQHQNKI